MPRHIEKVKHNNTIKIDGVRVEKGSSEWEAFSWKWRFYRFLEDLVNNPDLKNPLDLWDWDYMAQPDENYDLDDCINLLKKNKKTQSILKSWYMLGMPHDWYKIKAKEYQLELENGKPPYKNRIHGFGWYDPKTKKFVLDPLSVKG